MKSNVLTLSFAASILLACQPKNITSTTDDHSNDVSKAGTQESIEIKDMDLTVKPQDDFFQFANGNWCKNNPVPATESRWGSFNELDKSNNAILRQILHQYAEVSDKQLGSQQQLLGDYYLAFTNMIERNSLGTKPLIQRLEPIRAMKSKNDIVFQLAKLHRLKIPSLFSFGVGQNLNDVEKNIVYLSQGGLGLPNRDYYFQDNKRTILDAYKLYVQKAFEMAGETNGAVTIASDVIGFEKELANVCMTPAEMRIPELTNNVMSEGNVEKLFPKFDFQLYQKQIGCDSFDSLIVEQPKFIEQVNTLIDKASLESWKNYLSWCTINYYAPFLDKTWGDLYFDFYEKTMSGKSEMKPIDDRCIYEITGSALSELLGKAFVDKAFSSSAKDKVNSLVDNLFAAFRVRINNLDWMSQTTKNEALTKLNSIGRKLVCPNEWKSYNGLTISANDYIGNIDRCEEFSKRENLSKLHKPVDKNEWEMPAHLVNAYYHPLLNEIAFPAGIMQPPFFDENAEDALNYGRIGMVIGHELTHGFDDNGAKFAADGSYKDWWQQTDKDEFVSKTKILGETFDAFCPLPDNCVNSKLTMGENIADLGGLTIAFHAYQLTDEYKKNQTIKGYTPAQRFFIAYAQLWKINYTDAELKKRVATDPHSPGMYRVNGPLMNCPEFFEAFTVKPGDKMRNPETKVAKIW